MADRCRRAALDAWGLDAITKAMVDTLQDPSWTTRMMWRATVRLNLAYWPAIFVADSILSSFIGIGPIESAGAKIVIYGLSGLMTFGMAALLLRARNVSFTNKTLVCFALTAVAAPV